MHGLTALIALVSAISTISAAPLQSDDVAVTTPPVLGHVAIVLHEDGSTSFGPGAQDGIYMSHNDTHFTFHGTASESSSDKSARDIRPSRLAARQQSCDVTCEGNFGAKDDIDGAINSLANQFGEAFSFPSQVVSISGSAFAFGCNYNKKAPASGGKLDYQFDMACYRNKCGPTQAGFNNHRKDKTTYGVNIGSFNC